jgi:hypothetical protein
LSTRFFSNRDLEHDAPFEPLERQQALLLAALRKASGAPVSYAQLRDAGIEFPASVVSELELAGVSIERCYKRVDRSRHAIGVRLDPARDDLVISSDLSADVRLPEPLFESVPAAAAAAAAGADMGAAHQPDPRPRRRGRRSLAPAVPLAAASIALALLIVALTAGGSRSGHATVTHSRTRSSALAAISIRSAVAAPRRQAPQTQTSQLQAQTLKPPTPQTQPASQPPTTPVSAALAAQLEAHGHELLQTGQYAGAVPVLERALSATGESLRGCVQPASEQCLTYAYALYDLGRALMLSGAPAAAVSVLEHRLQIENQQAVVAAELQFARRQLG